LYFNWSRQAYLSGVHLYNDWEAQKDTLPDRIIVELLATFYKEPVQIPGLAGVVDISANKNQYSLSGSLQHGGAPVADFAGFALIRLSKEWLYRLKAWE
jgi:hypothetical protein